MMSYNAAVGSRSAPKKRGVTGIILAGGRNRRIATNKALLTVGDRSIIATTLETMAPIFEETLIVTNQPEEYAFLDVTTVGDVFPQKGPLGGLYSGLTASKSEHNFVVACDMPFLNSRLILYMLQSIGGCDVVVPLLEAGLEPLHAVYSKACLGPILAHLNKGDLRVQSFYGDVRTNYIRQAEIERFDPELKAFFNINCREDFHKGRALAHRE